MLSLSQVLCILLVLYPRTLAQAGWGKGGKEDTSWELPGGWGVWGWGPVYTLIPS